MSATAIDFNLHATIRDELEVNPSANPRDIASVVAKLVPDDCMRDALADALVAVVRAEIGNHRRAAQRSTFDTHSSRWENASQAYLALLRSREYVATEGEWKYLGDCTKSDVLAIVEQRRMLAEANATMATRYDRLAQVMGSEQTVADLPEDVVIEALR